MFSGSPDERISGTMAGNCIKIEFSPISPIQICIFKHIGFSDRRTLIAKVMISMYYFSSLRRMLSFILVIKLVLVLCIKSSLIMSLPAPTINKTFLNPITYGILRFRQLRGGGRGAFLAEIQKTRSWLMDWFEIWYQ